MLHVCRRCPRPSYRVIKNSVGGRSCVVDHRVTNTNPSHCCLLLVTHVRDTNVILSSGSFELSVSLAVFLCFVLHLRFHWLRPCLLHPHGLHDGGEPLLRQQLRSHYRGQLLPRLLYQKKNEVSLRRWFFPNGFKNQSIEKEMKFQKIEIRKTTKIRKQKSKGRFYMFLSILEIGVKASLGKVGQIQNASSGWPRRG